MTTFFRILICIILAIPASAIVNYLADVLPQSRRLTRPTCKTCDHPRAVREFLLMRRCANCNCNPPMRHSLVLISSILLFIVIGLLPLEDLGLAAGLIVLVYFMVVFVIDMEHRLILTETSIFGLILGILVGWHLHGILPTAAGGISGFLVMFGFYGLGIVFSKWMSKQRGEEIDEVALGFGDVTLSTILGLMVGFQQVFLLLLLTILLGGIFSLLLLIIMRILNRYQQFTAIPYAPFLLSAAAYLLFRP